jgi:hypothetical protein
MQRELHETILTHEDMLACCILEFALAGVKVKVTYQQLPAGDTAYHPMWKRRQKISHLVTGYGIAICWIS